MFKMKKYIKNNSGVISFLICLGICALCVIIFSLIAAIITSFLSDPTAVIDIFSFASLLISSVISAFIINKVKKEANILFSVAIGLGAILLMLTVCLISEGGGIGASALMNYVCFLGAFILSSMIAKKNGRKRHRRLSHK